MISTTPVTPAELQPLSDDGAPAAGLPPVAVQRLAVASQWQLVWWAFKRHRLAMAGLIVTAMLYIIAIVPDFFRHQRSGAAEPACAVLPRADAAFRR